MENFELGGGATLLGVFFLCTCVGTIAGNYLKNQIGTADAASANITVVNNNQISTIDQGTPTIVRTSTVTIKDTTATLGYHLSAQITQNTIPASTATIYSTSSTTCTQSSPCYLNTSTPTSILETTSTAATGASGHTTTWTVTITMPTNTPQGNYLLDIAYSEDPILPLCPVLTGKTYLQNITPPTNTSHGQDRERVVLKDRRNNQDYYVQNIANADGSCLAWMETNLRYAGNGNWSNMWGYPDDRYATTTANAANTANPNDNARPLTMTTTDYFGGSQDNAYTVAGVADRGGSTTLDTTNPQNNTTFYGYLYNWCAAMGGQPNACNDTSTTGFDTTTSICPAGWHLPTGGTGGEYQIMANAIGATNDAAGSTNLRNNFLAVYSGFYRREPSGGGGYYYSSTTDTTAFIYGLYLDPNIVHPAATNMGPRYDGMAVRCAL